MKALNFSFRCELGKLQSATSHMYEYMSFYSFSMQKENSHIKVVYIPDGELFQSDAYYAI